MTKNDIDEIKEYTTTLPLLLPGHFFFFSFCLHSRFSSACNNVVNRSKQGYNTHGTSVWKIENHILAAERTGEEHWWQPISYFLDYGKAEMSIYKKGHLRTEEEGGEKWKKAEEKEKEEEKS